jgi:hypothetical protein
MNLLLTALLTAIPTLTVIAIAVHAWAAWTIRKLDRPQETTDPPGTLPSGERHRIKVPSPTARAK